jgi:hypothetical protein
MRSPDNIRCFINESGRVRRWSGRFALGTKSRGFDNNYREEDIPSRQQYCIDIEGAGCSYSYELLQNRDPSPRRSPLRGGEKIVSNNVLSRVPNESFLISMNKCTGRKHS